MNVSVPILDSICLTFQDIEWIQTLDYEFIPFHCRRCHEHGHLYRDFPLLNPPKPSKSKPKKDEEGFTKISSRHHSNRKPIPQGPFGPSKNPDLKNSFDSLNSLPHDSTTIIEEISTPNNPKIENRWTPISS
jgi:hypothetical protein